MPRIRPVEERDAAAIAALLNPLIEAGAFTAMTEPATVDGQLAFQRGLPPRAIYLAAVAEETGELLGVQDVLPREGVLVDGDVSTFVRRDVHRRGVGAALTEATLAAARAHGYERLTATVRADNPGAVAFYRSRGFREIGRGDGKVRLARGVSGWLDYEVDGRDRAVPADGFPACDSGAPLPVVVARGRRLVLAYHVAGDPIDWEGGDYDRIVERASAPDVAVVVFAARAHRLGPPTEDDLEDHPLAARGLDWNGAFTVEHSSWARRFGGTEPLTHYVFTFHDETFECLAVEATFRGLRAGTTEEAAGAEP